MNITEFLEARIAEDEAYAAQAQGEHYGWIDYWTASTRQGARTESVIYAHAFRFDPERTLAECKAKRAIVELHDALEDKNWQSGKEHDYLWCGSCGTLDDAPVPYPCETLQVLAAVYKDHPDYQQEWAL